MLVVHPFLFVFVCVWNGGKKKERKVERRKFSNKKHFLLFGSKEKQGRKKIVNVESIQVFSVLKGEKNCIQNKFIFLS